MIFAENIVEIVFIVVLIESNNKNLVYLELDQTVKTSLGTIMDGVCRALKIRIEQVLVSQHDTILYKISNLIKFYDYTIR